MNTTTFFWSAINLQGQHQQGTLTAENKKNARKILTEKHFTILSLKKQRFCFFTQKKFSEKDLCDFTKQLLLFIRSGIALKPAFQMMIHASKNNTIKTILSQIQEKIIAGMSLSESLSAFPDYFNVTYCTLIRAGENSGTLEIILKQLIEEQTKKRHIKQKIIKALLYPTVVLCIAMLVTLGLLLFVMPQFHDIYQNFGASLPFLTQSLISASDLLKKEGIEIIAILTALIWLFKIMLKKSFFIKTQVGRALLCCPGISTLVIMKNIAMWSQVFATLMTAGIPLLETMSIANQTISHPIIQKALQHVFLKVKSGMALHQALQMTRYFPTRAQQFIEIGENTDSLETMMQQIATLYQEQLSDTLDHLSKLLEPVMMIVIASIIAGMILAMYLPIFQMGNII